MNITFIGFFFCLCIGYIVANCVKDHNLYRVLKEDMKLLEKIKKGTFDKEDAVRHTFNIEGRANLINRMFGKF